MPRLNSDGWTWRVHYSDGSMFDEYDANGNEHGFAEVENSRVVAVELQPQHPDVCGHVVKIDASRDAMRPIFFRRRSRIVNLETGGDTTGAVIHCIGWHKTVNGRNIAAYTFIFADGSTLTTDDYQAV
ncbi:MAG: hypothetical protein ACXWP0_03695 [Ktedonobacterales bacterium]